MKKNINFNLRMLFGTDESIVGVDYLNRSILINVSISDFYGHNDLFFRGSRSPKKPNKSNDSEEVTSDQVFKKKFKSYLKNNI